MIRMRLNCKNNWETSFSVKEIKIVWRFYWALIGIPCFSKKLPCIVTSLCMSAACYYDDTTHDYYTQGLPRHVSDCIRMLLHAPLSYHQEYCVSFARFLSMSYSWSWGDPMASSALNSSSPNYANARGPHVKNTLPWGFWCCHYHVSPPLQKRLVISMPFV